MAPKKKGRPKGSRTSTLTGSARKKRDNASKQRYRQSLTLGQTSASQRRIEMLISTGVKSEFENLKKTLKMTTNGDVLEYLLHHVQHDHMQQQADETSSDESLDESQVVPESPEATKAVSLPRRSPRKKLKMSYVDKGQDTTDTSSASESGSFVYPHSRFASLRHLMSTPTTTDPHSTSNFTPPMPKIRRPTLSASSDIPKLTSGSEISDIESLHSAMGQTATSEANQSGTGNQTSTENVTNRSGIWNVVIHDELLPSDGDTIIAERDETYHPSSAASSDSNIGDYGDVAEELMANAEFNFQPADDEDIVFDLPEPEDGYSKEGDDDQEEEEEEEETETELEGEKKRKKAKKFIKIENYDEHKDDPACFAFASCLKQLASSEEPTSCRKCSKPLEVTVKQSGTAIYLKWICHSHEKVHIEHEWCSQPRFHHGALLGDFICSCAVLFSGNDYTKLCLFLNTINCKPMSRTTYYKICNKYANDAIQETWQEQQDELLKEYEGQRDIILLGDGRMDSPGFNAEYCTYTLMEATSKDILDMSIINKRETGLNSVTMEREGCRQGLDRLIGKGLNISELASDAHVQITCMLRKEYPLIFHSLDVWHGAKNLCKRLTKVALEAKNKALLPWIRDIVNHFWYCLKTCEEFEEFVERWRGVQHHVVNKHEWIAHPTDANLAPMRKCDHDHLETPTDDKPWMESGSPAHAKMIDVILDPKFLKNIPKYLKFRNTSMLESFHNTILMYVPKRISFRPPAYKARCTLAALDHQINKERRLHLTKKGELSIQRRWRKSSKRWDVHLQKEQKSYHHVSTIMQKAVQKRIAHPELMKEPSTLTEDDPRRIMPRLTIVTPPQAKTLYEKKQSRL